MVDACEWCDDGVITADDTSTTTDNDNHDNLLRRLWRHPNDCKTLKPIEDHYQLLKNWTKLSHFRIKVQPAVIVKCHCVHWIQEIIQGSGSCYTLNRSTHSSYQLKIKLAPFLTAKVKYPLKLSDCRPISLINDLYKIISSLKTKYITSKKILLFKVDFDKAFDSINREYLDSILAQMGYGEKWRMWMLDMVSL
ncbi:hypothetical protein LXL04_031993 [Taraxacum kok-saghyz]